MISSIFGKTKPINYIIVLSFLFVFYWFVHFFLFERVYSPLQLLLQAIAFLLLMFSFFIVNFITKRNKITGTNSFSLLFYFLLMLVFPKTIADNNTIFCSFFLLLAVRRLISMKSLKNVKLKIFDASIWIMVSSLFYDWALLFLLVVFAAIYIYEPKNIRNWLVPFAALFAVFMISYSILILAGYPNFLVTHYKFNFQFNTTYFLDWGNGSKLIIYVLITFVTAVLAFLKLGSAGLGKIASMRLIALYFIVGLVLKVLTTTSDAYPILITFFPAVVFFTNYIESIRKANIKEIVLMASIVIPLLVFLVEVSIK